MGLSNSNQLRNLKIRELKESLIEINDVGMDVDFLRFPEKPGFENV
jgi:hypothetical protein